MASPRRCAASPMPPGRWTPRPAHEPAHAADDRADAALPGTTRFVVHLPGRRRRRGRRGRAGRPALTAGLDVVPPRASGSRASWPRSASSSPARSAPHRRSSRRRPRREAGFRSAWISDHFHPWNDAQGESPFVWSVLGARRHGDEEMRWMTRHLPDRPHPSRHRRPRARHRHAHAGPLPARRRQRRSAQRAHLRRPLARGRCTAGDARGGRAVIRRSGRAAFRHHGTHYTLEGARLYSLPESRRRCSYQVRPQGDRARRRIADGYVTVGPDADASAYRAHGGSGRSAAG